MSLKLSSAMDSNPKENDFIEKPIEYQGKSGVHLWVWRTIQGLILLMGAVVGYRYYNSHSCEEIAVDFAINNITSTEIDTVFVGETVTFSDFSKYAKFTLWKFGDGFDEFDEKGKKQVNHMYQKEGEFYVSLQVNDKCEKTKRLRVIANREDISFTCPMVVIVGKPIRFTNQTPNSPTSQWDFGDNTKGTGKSITHTYALEGTKIITLMINNDKKRIARRRVTVVPEVLSAKKAPEPYIPEKKPEPKKDSLIISKIPIVPPLKTIPIQAKVEVEKIQIEEFIMQVAEKRKKATDFLYYSCNTIDFGVRANRERLSFKEFCTQIEGKKIILKSIDLQKNDNGCIIYLKIDYRKIRF